MMLSHPCEREEKNLLLINEVVQRTCIPACMVHEKAVANKPGHHVLKFFSYPWHLTRLYIPEEREMVIPRF